MVEILGTVAARTTWTEQQTGFMRKGTLVHELVYEDWTVAGVPLRERVLARREDVSSVREVTPLCEMLWWPEAAVAALRRLLGDEPGDFEDGRVSLLVCPIDADLGCRALSATLVFEGEVVEWRDVGWQVYHMPFVVVDDGFDPPMHLRFDRKAYVELLRALLGRFEAVVAARTSAEDASRRRFWRP